MARYRCRFSAASYRKIESINVLSFTSICQGKQANSCAIKIVREKRYLPFGLVRVQVDTSQSGVEVRQLARPFSFARRVGWTKHCPLMVRKAAFHLQIHDGEDSIALGSAGDVDTFRTVGTPKGVL